MVRERGLIKMKALKCKTSAQFTYNCTINVLSKCSNIISHRSLVFEGRHNDHRYSKVGTSIIHLRRSTHRSSKVDTSTLDLRRSTYRSWKIKGGNIAQTPNIAPTFRQFVTKYCPPQRSININYAYTSILILHRYRGGGCSEC